AREPACPAGPSRLNHKTVWRWRHAVLRALAAQPAPRLGGVVEADELFFRRCFKGRRDVRAVAGRPPRRRGGATRPDGSPRGLGRDKVALLTARARGGGAVTAVLERVDGETVAAALSPVLAPDAELCTDGAKAYLPLARAPNLVHHRLAGRRRRVRGIFHIQHVNGYTAGWGGGWRASRASGPRTSGRTPPGTCSSTARARSPRRPRPTRSWSGPRPCRRPALRGVRPPAPLTVGLHRVVVSRRGGSPVVLPHEGAVGAAVLADEDPASARTGGARRGCARPRRRRRSNDARMGCRGRRRVERGRRHVVRDVHQGAQLFQTQ